MTVKEEYIKAWEYLDKLECWIWHDFKDTPEDIANKVFEMIDSDSFSKEYRLSWTVYKEPPFTEFMFFKSKNCEYQPIKFKQHSSIETDSTNK